ncbi:MAG: M14 family metallocarboxypeptidase [Actinobacteria bacterium]|nr:M14 family metallocarboxypeptidase [Actinomycetota bacterium]
MPKTVLTRRRFLQGSGAVGAALSLPFTLAGRPVAAPGEGDGPRTGFEEREGASWTTHDEELGFLADVASARPDRLRLTELARTSTGRPLQLAALGAPVAGALAGETPTTLFVCSQHGNEPAGREAGLKLVRDLAFTEDPALRRLLDEQTVLVVPAANPDGRAANTRGNADRVDINRDHLNLATTEARAIARLIRDWAPSLILDLHEYGPSAPVLYDDDLLYLWPRNLNVDQAVHDNAKSFCLEYLRPDAHAQGYSADEYGLYKVGPNVGPAHDLGVDVQVAQVAGNGDEGICRNAVGLRHALGILVESAVTQNLTNGPGDIGTAGNQTRRVASQEVVTASALRYMLEQGEAVKLVTDSARGRKTREGLRGDVPVYFDGADNEAPTVVADPPPSGYRLTSTQAAELAGTLDLHAIERRPSGPGEVTVSMAQPAEPVIPLLLDARGKRHSTAATPVD